MTFLIHCQVEILVISMYRITKHWLILKYKRVLSNTSQKLLIVQVLSAVRRNNESPRVLPSKGNSSKIWDRTKWSCCCVLMCSCGKSMQYTTIGYRLHVGAHEHGESWRVLCACVGYMCLGTCVQSSNNLSHSHSFSLIRSALLTNSFCHVYFWNHSSQVKHFAHTTETFCTHGVF